MKETNILMRDRARVLRNALTDAEKLLWNSIRRCQIKGVKFKRQYLIGSYIVDFICHSHKLIIEVDGNQHMEQTEYDANRTEFLEARGYKVLRFWNNEIFLHLSGVLESIWLTINTPSPTLPRKAREGV